MESVTARTLRRSKDLLVNAGEGWGRAFIVVAAQDQQTKPLRDPLCWGRIDASRLIERRCERRRRLRHLAGADGVRPIALNASRQAASAS